MAFSIGGARPTMKDLSQHIIPAVATKWYELGLELMDSSHEKVLKNIERDGSRFDVQWCCKKMLTKWLEVSDDATWGQVIDAVKNINMCDVASNLESLLPQSSYTMEKRFSPAKPSENAMFQELCFLKEREDLRNILIVDYGSLHSKQRDLDAILSCSCLKKYFYVVILIENSCKSVAVRFPPSFNEQICSILKIPSEVIRNVHTIPDHIVTQIVVFINQYCYHRAYYCLSLDPSFPQKSEIMEHTDIEYTYCSVIKAVRDFIYLDTNYFKESDDPTVMNVYPLLKNDVERAPVTEKSGKLMIFSPGEMYFDNNSIKSVWKELKEFGNVHSLHVSITTAFPATIDIKVSISYPEMVRPKFYRFAIYLADTSDDNVLSVLDHLRSTKLVGGRVTVKLDSTTKERRFGSYGDKKISKAIYRIAKFNIQKQYVTESGKRYYKFVEDEQVIQLMNEAKKDGYTMKVRHAKILFCGASGAGKTSFVRFLKNEKFRDQYHSTGLGNTQQIMIARKATIQGTEWVDLNPAEELHQLKLRIHYKLLSKPTPHDSKYVELNESTVVIAKPPTASHKDSRFTDLPKAQPESCKPPLKIPQHIITEERLYSKSPNLTSEFKKPLPVWDILTLLDTGGQPQFINMLPAVNTSATVTFVVLNMLHVLGAKGFDERVQVHHYRYGIKSYEPYPLNYTNKDLIKCLTALLNDSMVKDIPLPGVLPIPPSESNEDQKSHLCFVGTHLDMVKEEDVDKVNKEVEKLIAQLEPSGSVSVWNYDKKALFTVDNTVAGKKEFLDGTIVDRIRTEIKTIMDKKATYEVPVTWMILEMEIRLVCGRQKSHFMIISDVVKMYKKLISGCDDDTAELQVKAALRFHHMFGILLYFHEVPGMDEFVICNPQWLFTNLTNFVCCSFDETIVDHKALNNLKSKGILSKSLIGKINTDSLGGIKLESFLELLKYLNIITQYPTNDSRDYLMLAILDSYKDEESDLLKSMPPIHGVEFVIQFNSGTLPRGVFCCLVVQLVQKVKSWKLQVELPGKRCIYSNFVAFCAAEFGQYILLLDKVSHLEIQVTQSEFEENSESIHFDVQQTIITALQQISTHSCNKVDLKCGFYCKTKPCLIFLLSDHMTGQKSLPRGLHCENHGLTELKSHKLWCENSKISQARNNIKLQIKFPGQLKECPEETVFTENYSNLTGVLNFLTLIPHFITKRIITVDDASDIKSPDRESEKNMKLLEYIARPLKAGYTESFDVMKTHCTIAVEALANDMESSLQTNSSKGCEGDVTSQLPKSISLPTDESSGKGNSQSYNHSISEPAGRSSTD